MATAGKPNAHTRPLKVLFVDTWTNGIHNFTPVAEELARHGVESLLVHRGSLGAQPGRPDEEVIGGLKVRDIRYYRTSLIYDVLRQEDPDSVLQLNTDMISDRAIILGAKALGIKTAYTMHGVMAVGEQRDEDMRGYASSLRRTRFRKAAKYVRYTLPDYFRSGIASSWTFPLRLAPYDLIARTFLKPEQYVHYPPASPELNCDLAFMWGAGYVELVRDLGYPPERIRIVGHPPLDRAFRLRNQAVPVERSPKVALFLEGGLVEGGYAGWTPESRIALIEELADAAESAGYRLKVKLHPNARAESVFEAMKKQSRWEAVQLVNLTDIVNESDAVISHSSTSVTVALVLDKPVFIPRWGISSIIPDYYGSSGVAVACDSLDTLRAGLRDPAGALAATSDARQRFSDTFFGPTDGRAVERIAAGLIELARARRSGSR